jgi:hypothetical protein
VPIQDDFQNYKGNKEDYIKKFLQAMSVALGVNEDKI